MSLLPGCATTRPVPASQRPSDTVYFQKASTIDFRKDTVADYERLVRPGDLIVASMRLGRAVRQRDWLFAVLPQGHSMIVLDPADREHGILECRFHGARRVGPDELRQYSYCTVYRLNQPARLDRKRLEEFADSATACCRRYDFWSWIGWNDELRPSSAADISPQYTCSTMAVAAYFYAGLHLDVAGQDHKVITPLSIVASPGRYRDGIVRGAEPGSDATKIPTEDGAVRPAGHHERSRE